MGGFKGRGSQYILIGQDSVLQIAGHWYASDNFPT